MAYSHNPDMFSWKRFTKTKNPTANKLKCETVEMASDFAVTEVFSLKKPHSGISSQTMALKNTEQLLDHDEAYGEAQALLSDWMNSKLRLELEMEEDVIVSPERNSPVAMAPAQPVSLDYSNFDDLYSHLAEEEESSVVNNFLQDLMEREVVESGITEKSETGGRGGTRVLPWRRVTNRGTSLAGTLLLERRSQQVFVSNSALIIVIPRRRCQMAMESDRRRMLRRCLSDWRLWCRAARGRRELLAQQEETRCKMAALINAAATGKLKVMETPAPEPITAPPETFDQSETTELVWSRPVGPTPSTACQGDGQLGAVVPPTLAWQVTQRHAALSAGELRRARQRGEVGEGGGDGGEGKSMIGLKQEAQIAQLAVPAAPGPRGMTSVPKEPRAGSVSGGNDGRSLASRKPAVRQPCRHPTAQLKAAEEERQWEEEEEKHRAAERRREKRREREENQRRLEREQQLQTQAQQHYHRTLLLRRGLAPWKRIVAMSQANTQLKDHRMVLEGRANRLWRTHMTQKRMVEWDREQQAQEHSDRRAVRSCFQAWRRYLGWLREERETRREQLKRTVEEVLPDFRSSPLNCPWEQALLDELIKGYVITLQRPL
ncbi:unnamed protein product, partial [Coregonus sp. 'balchen']